MKYELAVRLKEAGFPFRDEKHFEYRPTLSELIQAVGEDFDKVGQDPTTKGKWLARVFSIDKLASGSSPEEAVANLWLALNEK